MERQGSSDLFEPSLQGDSVPTRTYDLGPLLYVAFFGGPVATAAICTRNGLWLRVDRRLLYALGAAALGLVLVKGLWPLLSDIPMTDRYLRWTFRGLSVLLYFGYRWALTPAFKQHMVLHGEVKPLFWDAIIAILVGGAVEFGLILLINRAVVG